MKPRTKFFIGGALVIGTAGYLAASAIKDTGLYYLTPGTFRATTLLAKCASRYENTPEKYKNTQDTSGRSRERDDRARLELARLSIVVASPCRVA